MGLAPMRREEDPLAEEVELAASQSGRRSRRVLEARDRRALCRAVEADGDDLAAAAQRCSHLPIGHEEWDCTRNERGRSVRERDGWAKK